MLARKSRLKVKGEAEVLKARQQQLAAENLSLRQQLSSLPSPALDITALSSGALTLPSSIAQVLQQQLVLRSGSAYPLEEAAYWVSSAASPRWPIVYASKGFLDLTGYAAHEVLGRRSGISAQQQDHSCALLSCGEDDRPFWIHLDVSHVKDMSGRALFAVALATACTAEEVLLQQASSLSSSLPLPLVAVG